MYDIVLQMLFKCNFHIHISSHSLFEHWEHYHWWKRAMCHNPSLKHICMNVTALENTCFEKSSVVIKIIHCHNKCNLQKFLYDDIMIIYLVRDPRAVTQSRFQLLEKLNLSETALARKTVQECKTYCMELENDVLLIKQLDIRRKLQNILKLIRFEDIALHPFRKTKELFSFLNISMNNKTIVWLQENTHLPQITRKKDPYYSTSRNSSNIVKKWMTDMKERYRLIVENICNHTINRLGYTVTENFSSSYVLNFINDAILDKYT